MAVKNNAAAVKFKKLLSGNGAFIALIALLIAASFMYEEFFTLNNMSNVLRQMSMVGLMSVGMTLVILTAGIDLSVGATVAISAIIAARLSNHGILPAIAVPLVIGAVIGGVNGFIVNNLRIVPFIATLAVQMALRGAAYLMTDMKSIAVNRSEKTFIALGRGYFLGVPVPVIIFLAVSLIMIFICKKTGFGRSVYAIGGNEDAAGMMGLRVKRDKMLCYVITGFLSSLAGVILCARLGAGQPVSGEGWEMDSIASVAIGGTLLTGGVGGVEKTICGVLIIGFIKNIINLQGDVNSYWQKIIMGLILLLVVMIQNKTFRKGAV
ncbi:MAG: ABC transporter permease [Synergistaceae bacterium]|jgi:ribose transport system permease protein|nr:ABC transporter permease [Synergistaceae bacterium]